MTTDGYVKILIEQVEELQREVALLKEQVRNSCTKLPSDQHPEIDLNKVNYPTLNDVFPGLFPTFNVSETIYTD